jgi:uncharacterized protein (DUF3820 family)
MKKGDDEHLYSENGDKRPLTTRDYIIPFGKYQGMRVSDITDRGYLEWLYKVKEDDWYLRKIVGMRLKEYEDL